MKWNAVIILALGFAHLAGAKHVVDMHEDHYRLRGLVDLDRVPGHPHRNLQECNTAQSVTTQSPPFGLGCMEDYPSSQSYNCNSNEVRIAGVNIKQLRDADGNVIPPVNGAYECSEGGLLSVDFTATVLNGAKSTRFDAAVFWSNGPTAKNGNDCSYSSFTAVGSAAGATDGLPNLEDPTADPSEDDNCGDMPGQTTDYADICGLNIVCQDLSPNGGTSVTVASCMTWKLPGDNELCSNTDPESFLPGTPSKCKCEFTEFPISIKNPPTITKTCTDGVLVPDYDDVVGQYAVQWTVGVSITNNNDSADLDNWEVTDEVLLADGSYKALDFDRPLDSSEEGVIPPITDTNPNPAEFTRTITVLLPSENNLNGGFTDRVTLTIDSDPTTAVTDDATCDRVCEFTALCDLGSITPDCDVPTAEADPNDVFNIGPLPCGTLVLSSNDSGDPCGMVTRTYTLLDDLNGNEGADEGEETATCVQTITVIDGTPTLTAPEDTTVECPGSTLPSETGEATASDVCDDDLQYPGYADSVVDGCGGTKVITRTWSVTDSCQQTSTEAQTVTVVDTTPPVITCPGPDSLGCASNLGVLPTIGAANDACEGPITPVYNGCCFDTVDGLTLDRTWTATDSCGNAASCTQENPLTSICTILPPP